MKIKQTNISKYLQCAHTNLHSDYIPAVDKVKRTREKLNNVIQRDVKEHGGVLFTSFRREDFLTDKERIESIMNAIGVYRIPHPSEQRPFLWDRIDLLDDDSEKQDWYDYLGNPHIITTSGGRITVLLSDEGVEYMNKCAMKVGFRPSPTRKNSEVEILPPNEDDVKNLIEQFDTFLNEDDTDWSIGTKLIQQFWDPKANLKIVQSLREGSL
jgi:hypothetical protein